MKNGVIQNWGLVEFFDSDSAELTQEKVQGHLLPLHASPDVATMITLPTAYPNPT